jgi:hypothetical protein
MRFSFDPRKSQRLRVNPQLGIGFEEAQACLRVLTGSKNDQTLPSNIAPSAG